MCTECKGLQVSTISLPKWDYSNWIISEYIYYIYKTLGNSTKTLDVYGKSTKQPALSFEF